jgi:squalene-hopene/tetraprenyl-beta-curcumene cyclase
LFNQWRAARRQPAGGKPYRRANAAPLAKQGETRMRRLLGHACWTACAAGLLLGGLARPARAADAVGPDPKEVQAVLDKALVFLKQHQNEDGSFSPKLAGPGVSALVVAGLLRNGVSPNDPVVARALAYMEKRVKKDGGIYDRALANYTTSVALMAFKEANKNGKYDTLIANAVKFLKGLQDSSDPKNVKSGGVGYDGKKRPDLSNTQYFIDAMLKAGVPKDDPAIQRALKFVGRCQNIKGEFNDQPFAKKASKDDEGGFTYNPDPDDNPHKTSGGGLRSLGAMTYGGLKSFLYAGVKKEDPRVKAAVGWIRRHYTLDENPGMGQGGLYYYYHTFAKAMDALGEDRFEDADGKSHDWRREVFEALKKRQNSGGGWANSKDRAFGEKDPVLATAFAVLTLSYCKPAAK